MGEAGVNLPTSVAQIISIARALIGRPGVLLLDDVTAPLPPGIERRVIDGMRRLTDHVTVVAVAAPPALLALADDIVLLDEGNVAAQGTLEELVASSHAFRSLLAHWRLDRDPSIGRDAGRSS